MGNCHLIAFSMLSSFTRVPTGIFMAYYFVQKLFPQENLTANTYLIYAVEYLTKLTNGWTKNVCLRNYKSYLVALPLAAFAV